MFLGPSPPLYTLLAGVFIILGIYTSLVDLAALRNAAKDILYTPKGIETMGWKTKLTLVPVALACGWFAYAVGVTSWWYNQTTTVRNFKAIWLISPLYIYMSVCFLHLMDHLSAWASVKAMLDRTVPGASDMMKRYRLGANGWAFTLYAFSVLALSTHILMSIMCLYYFTGGVEQPSSTTRSFTVATGAILLAILMIEMVIVLRLKRGTTVASNFYEGLAQNGAMRLKGVQLKQDLSKLEGKTVKFGPTGDQLFPASDPNVAMMHHIEQQVLAKGPQYGLSVKNYAVVQNGFENDYLVLSQEMAAKMLSQDPISHVDRIKYGMMGYDDFKYEFTAGPLTGKEAAKVNYFLAYRPTSGGLLHRSYGGEPPILRFTDHVCGNGYGYGIWYNYSCWLGYLFTLYMLTINIQVYRDGGTGLVYTIIGCLPALFMSMFGLDGQWFQLFAWNQLLAPPVAIYPEVAQNTNLYLMNKTIMDDNSTASLQNPYAPTIGDTYDAQFTGYFAFASACVFLIATIAKAANAPK
jgi:hypothetical protein